MSHSALEGEKGECELKKNCAQGEVKNKRYWLCKSLNKNPFSETILNHLTQ